MAKYICPGDTIEGDAIEVVARKIVPTSAVKRSDVKKTMFGYYTDKNSWAKVTKTHIPDEDEDIINATVNYHRSVGDELECDGLKVYADQRRPVRINHTEGVTASHGANYASFTIHTIARIQTPIQSLQKAIALLDSSNQKLIETQ